MEDGAKVPAVVAAAGGGLVGAEAAKRCGFDSCGANDRGG